MTKAYSYVRMSTEIQLRGDSKRRQYQLSRDYAAKHDLELVEDIDGLRLEDLGVSGYRGLNADSGALSVFIEAMKRGKIEKGSYLLVESLDRLSRETTAVALNRFMEIIAGNIVIVTLFDGAVYSSETLSTNPHMLFVSIVGMMRANEESETKSKRLAAAWENKRKLIGKKNLTRICPAWLKYDDKLEKFVIDESKASVVRLIFEMCATTTGASGITRHLNKNKIPVFGRAKSWGRSYILKIIHNRSVLGELQPHKVSGGKREEVGDPIVDYYPSVIDEALFLSAHAAISRRKITSRGRKGSRFGNVFTGLMYCRHCGEKMQYRDRGVGPKGGQYLICRTNLEGNQCVSPEWRISEIEALIFKHLQEVDLGSLVDKDKSKIETINENISINEQMIEAANKKIQRIMDTLFNVDLSLEVQNKFSIEIKKEEAIVKSKTEEIRLMAEEKIQIIDGMSFNNPESLKRFIDVYTENIDNYEFRSGINELMRKTISRIELFQRDYLIDPTEYDDDCPEVISYRQRSLKASGLKIDDLVGRPSFADHCKWLSREIYIKYKYGEMRYINFGGNISFLNKDISRRFNIITESNENKDRIGSKTKARTKLKTHAKSKINGKAKGKIKNPPPYLQ